MTAVLIARLEQPAASGVFQWEGNRRFPIHPTESSLSLVIWYSLPRAELCKTRVLYELLHVLQCEDLASGGKKKLLHVLAAYAETPTGNAGDNFEFRLVRRLTFQAKCTEMLNARDLVARRAVILRKFGFYDDLRVELIGDHEVGGLVETGQALRGVWQTREGPKTCFRSFSGTRTRKRPRSTTSRPSLK